MSAEELFRFEDAPGELKKCSELSPKIAVIAKNEELWKKVKIEISGSNKEENESPIPDMGLRQALQAGNVK